MNMKVVGSVRKILKEVIETKIYLKSKKNEEREREGRQQNFVETHGWFLWRCNARSIARIILIITTKIRLIK